jgi:predicted dehydrogenase
VRQNPLRIAMLRHLPKRIGIGLSGAGAMGSLHARVLSRLGAHCELTGVYDVDAARARALGRRWGMPVAASFDALLDRCEAVIIASSTDAHAEQVLAAAGAGRHVLVEKPAAGDLAGALALRERLGCVPTVVQVGHIEHFNPSVAALKRALGGDVPLAVSGRRLGPPTVRDQPLDVVTDLMLHDIQVVMELRPGALSGAYGVALGGALTHYAHATLRFSSGMVADLTASRIAQTRLRLLEATTAGAHLTADYTRGAVLLQRWDADRGRTRVEHLPVDTVEPLESELLAFLHAVRSGGPPEVGLDDAVACLRVVDAVRRSAEADGAGVLWVGDDRSEDGGAAGRAGAARAGGAPAG